MMVYGLANFKSKMGIATTKKSNSTERKKKAIKM
jgi:hypothetical protein